MLATGEEVAALILSGATGCTVGARGVACGGAGIDNVGASAIGAAGGPDAGGVRCSKAIAGATVGDVDPQAQDSQPLEPHPVTGVGGFLWGFAPRNGIDATATPDDPSPASCGLEPGLRLAVGEGCSGPAVSQS